MFKWSETKNIEWDGDIESLPDGLYEKLMEAAHRLCEDIEEQLGRLKSELAKNS